MYTPKQFTVDPEQAAAFLSQVEAADLVTMTERGLIAEAGALGALRGHVARKNEQWQLPAVGEALVIVHGQNAYIHSGWYPSKAEHALDPRRVRLVVEAKAACGARRPEQAVTPIRYMRRV